MKKKILAILCAAVLCVGILAYPLSVGAAGDPCFAAVNDNLLPLEDAYIPITIDGQYYIPYTVLDSNSTGVGLGIFPIHNATSNNLTIYNREQVLSFALSKGTCEDRNGNLQPARAVIRNNRIYVPARFTSEYFGLTYTLRMSTYGPLLRVCSGSAILDDNNFVGAAQMQMEDLLREWRKSQGSDPGPSVTPIPTPSTPTPGVTPSLPTTDKSGVHTYLAFRAEQTDGLTDMLVHLEMLQVRAIFFFPATELAGYDDAVRQVLCGGHAVGFLVTGTDKEEIGEQVAEGNRLLARIVHLNTYTILAADEETDWALQRMQTDFLRWDTDVDAGPNGQLLSRQINAIMEKTADHEENVFLLSDTTAAGAALMGRLLPRLAQDRYDLRLAVETELKAK